VNLCLGIFDLSSVVVLVLIVVATSKLQDAGAIVMFSSRCYFLLLVLAPFFAAGCGRGPAMSEVEGTVKVKGQPVDGIQVEFWPDADGPRSRGTTDGQGHFVLSTDDGLKKGAVVGKHRVILTDVGILGNKILGRAGEDVDMTQGKQPRIADAYRGPQTSPLSKEVVAGKKNEFELDVDPRGG